MKKNFFNSLLIVTLMSLLLCSCQKGETGPKGDKGDPGDTGSIGPQGETGQNGAGVLTGHGSPNSGKGIDGDSYIDLDSWNYFIKTDGSWVQGGNIKGEKGNNGNNGVSIVSTFINEDGDLIVTLSNDQVINAGHVKNVEEFTVKFYCDDILVDIQYVNNGEKLSEPVLEDFTVLHWYLEKDFEHEWLLYGSTVTEDMTLYGKYTAVEKHLSYSKTKEISVDEYGYGFAIDNEKEVCVSKAIETTDYLTTLDDRGIIFNKSEIGIIGSVDVKIAESGFVSANIFYGNSPLSITNSTSLNAGNNHIVLGEQGFEYFTIQNTSGSEINVESLNISYGKKAKYINNNIPTVVINTKNSQAVTSRTTYVDCNVSTVGAEKDVSELQAQIKVRGNSTAYCPKKPYRIKLNKKNSLFGYEKAKNWVLLADYMDGSKMHNYSALKFAKLVRGEDSFGADPLHVNVVLNGENIGIYEFCEHIDAKEGRLNIEQDNIWEKSFDEINFYIERDYSTTQDSTEIEGTTYFRINNEDYTPEQYVFALKYPEKEDFEEELGNDEIDYHEDEFQAFFNNLKDYMTDICQKFVAYSKDVSTFSAVASSVDVESLAEFAVVDQAFRESDHGAKSFKMYRTNGGLLKFGPNWDYDSCSIGLPYKGTYVLDPYTVGWNNFESLYIGDKWGYMLYNDTINGRHLFKEIWETISLDEVNEFVSSQYNEIDRIYSYVMFDCERWMNNQYYCVFDNLQYYVQWISTQINYVKNYYSNI